MWKNPINVLINNHEVILECYHTSGTSKKAWKRLKEILPELSKKMIYSTFNRYITMFSFIMVEVKQWLKDIEEEKDALQFKLSEAMTRIEELENNVKQSRRQELNKKSKEEESDDIYFESSLKRELKNFKGWNVQRGRDGYYRLFKKIKGRVRGIYIGKSFDFKKAEEKIKAKEEELMVKI